MKHYDPVGFASWAQGDAAAAGDSDYLIIGSRDITPDELVHLEGDGCFEDLSLERLPCDSSRAQSGSAWERNAEVDGVSVRKDNTLAWRRHDDTAGTDDDVGSAAGYDCLPLEGNLAGVVGSIDVVPGGNGVADAVEDNGGTMGGIEGSAGSRQSDGSTVEEGYRVSTLGTGAMALAGGAVLASLNASSEDLVSGLMRH